MEEISWGDKVDVVAVVWGVDSGGEGAGLGAGLYLTGDSLARNSWREGSRLRRGSLEESEGGVLFQNQPMVEVD